MRTSIYVDGFNFYYWLKPTPYLWVDLRTLALKALTRPGIRHDITSVKYFTARVSSTPEDPHQDRRQDTYLQALAASIPGFTPYFGEFRRKRQWMRSIKVAELRKGCRF